MTKNWELQAHGNMPRLEDTLVRRDWADQANQGRTSTQTPPGRHAVPVRYQSVLIVDDDPVFRTTIEAFFKSHGTSNVLQASEGAQAYSALSKGQVCDLVILDLNMPELDGIEFLELMKEHKITMPLLVISSAGRTAIKSAETLATVYGLNFLGAMSKPVDFDELRRVLKLTKGRI